MIILYLYGEPYLIHRFIHSSIVNSWLSNIVLLFSSLIAIPVVITKLNVEEINVWFLFSSIVSLGQGVLFGFNVTFTRFIAYSYSGVRINEFREIKDKTDSKYLETFDQIELSRIYFLMKRIYAFLSFIFFIILMLIGIFVLNKPIESLTTQNNGWIAWSIVVISTTITLIFGYYRVFLLGINKVALVQRIVGLVNIIGLIFILGVLFQYPTLVSIVFVYQLVALSTTVTIILFARKELKSLGIQKQMIGLDKSLFTIVWKSAWKSGITSLLANIVKHISAIIISQLFAPAQSASFLFTKKLFDVIERFTMISFQARIPVIARLRGRGDFHSLIPYLRQTQYISFGVFIICYFMLLLFGETLLILIKGNVQLGSVSLFILFSFATFLGRWGGMNLAIANQANHVVEHLNAILGSTVFFIVIYLFYDNLGINVFPFAQIMGFFFVLFLFIKNVYPTLNTTFISYEKKVMFPFLSILILINVSYYLMSN
jgi:hypothetical protein